MDSEKLQEYVESILTKIDSKEGLDIKDIDQAINVLESVECWNPLIKLLERLMPKTNIKYYNKLYQIYTVYLQDMDKSADICAKAISCFHLKYSDFQKFIQSVIDENYNFEAYILQKVYVNFESLSDKEKALERLCLLYDKKLSNAEGVQDVCNVLLQINPLNLKALKFFKIVYLQAERWDKVCEILIKMIRATNSKQNIYRFAQELAGIYLYQLDKPKEAIRIIEQYCFGSPLDCSFILFEAYKNLSDWNNCIKILDQLLKDTDSKEEHAILYFKKAKIYENIGKIDLYEKNLLEAIRCDNSFLEPIEYIMYSKVFNKDWKGLIKIIDLFIERVKNTENRNKFIEFKTRLTSCLINTK